MTFTREILHKRHRLSHQQIDRWLGENRSKEFLKEKMQHLKMVQDFIRVTDLLRENEIPFTSLKGALLSQRIYNDPTVRFSHDIDILIDRSKIDATIKIFLNNNYNLTEGSFWPEKKSQQELIINNGHHISFYNKELRLCVEIHWTLMHTLPVSQQKIKKIVAQNQTEVFFSGRKFTVLNPEFELLFLLLHGSRHGWERLKWLVDIKDYPFEKLDIEAFKKLVKTFNAERIIGQTNFLLEKFFDKRLPNTIKQKQNKKLNQIAIAFIESENVLQYTNEEVKRIYLNYFLMFPGVLYKFQTLLNILFRIEDIRAINSPFKIIYYIYRPYSFIKRRILHT